MKTCKGCKVEKELTEFNYHKDNQDHLTGKCKSCILADRKKRQNANFSPDLTGTKFCVRCEQDKPKSGYIFNKSTKDGFNGWCKECSKDAVMLAKYKLSLNDYNSLLESQNSTCALCGTQEPKGRQNVFVVDHCHKTGKVRGLLCNHCNTGIGKLQDDPELLRKAASYIEANRML